jgi:hypothetical protein
VAANGVFIRNLVHRLLILDQRGELYFGGHIGLIADTAVSLIDSYFYNGGYPLSLRWILVGGLIVTTGVATVLVLASSWKARRWSLPAIVAVLFVLAAAAPVAEHVLTGSLYPLGRTALYYVPVIGVLITLAADQMMRYAAARRNRRQAAIFSHGFRALSILLGGCMVAHLAAAANLHSAHDWPYDANTKPAMLELDRQAKLLFPGQSRIHLANYWVFEPSLTYYRALFQFDWLEVAPRDAIPTQETDVYYGSESDLHKLNPAIEYTIIKAYEDSDTVLARISKTP